MNDPFNPESGYEAPKGDSKYLKFEKGTTKFMPLASAIVGYEYWNTEGKPVRLTEKPETLPADLRNDPRTGKPESIKHFWAFPVFDYADSRVKVLEITQKGIQTTILEHARNPEWGSPVLRYSFTVKRDGDGLDTEYTVMANPAPVQIPTEIVTAWEQARADGFDINRLFTGGDPFSADGN